MTILRLGPIVAPMHFTLLARLPRVYAIQHGGRSQKGVELGLYAQSKRFSPNFAGTIFTGAVCGKNTYDLFVDYSSCDGEDAPIGLGASEEEAALDLLEQLDKQK
jgi:hypothetical protein